MLAFIASLVEHMNYGLSMHLCMREAEGECMLPAHSPVNAVCYCWAMRINVLAPRLRGS